MDRDGDRSLRATLTSDCSIRDDQVLVLNNLVFRQLLLRLPKWVRFRRSLQEDGFLCVPLSEFRDAADQGNAIAHLSFITFYRKVYLRHLDLHRWLGLGIIDLRIHLESLDHRWHLHELLLLRWLYHLGLLDALLHGVLAPLKFLSGHRVHLAITCVDSLIVNQVLYVLGLIHSLIL